MELMNEYLRGRRQRVKLDGVCSQWRTVKTGVPQGSLLGPLLFNIYINDLNYFISNTSLRLYADDTTEYASDSSPMVLEFLINSDLSLICKWFRSNYLKINATKSQAMAIGPSSYEYKFTLDNKDVVTNETLKILGVILDHNLTFKAHIKEQLSKACAKASALRRVRRFIPIDTMVCLYKAYILPHLEYCGPLMLGISKGLATKMEDTNYYILRTILGYPKSVSYDFLLALAKIKSLIQRREFQSLVIVYKSLNSQSPLYISEFFDIKNVEYNLRGVGTRLEQPSFNLEWLHRSFTYLASRLWNNVPPSIRESKDLNCFKSALRAHMA